MNEPAQHSAPRRQRIAFYCVSVIIFFVAGYLIGTGTALSVPIQKLLSLEKGSTPTFSRVEEVWNTLKSQHSGTMPSETDAVYGAIRGLVQSFNDPYTVFFTPKENSSFQEEIQGTFEGIGAEIGIKKNQLVVIAPLPDSPAEKASLKAGDEILMINNELTVDLTLDEAVQKIRGKQGTTVTLKIRPVGTSDVKDLSIERKAITVKSVKMDFLENNIADLKLSYFGPKTPQEFGSAVNELVTKNARGLILDLRNNPGGYLDAAVDVSSHFVDEGKVVVIEKYPDGKEDTYVAKRSSKIRGIPIVVLIDHGSASGSEIVAGALQDYTIARLVGAQSYGKGSVQELKDFFDGSSLKITIAKWFTPNGRSINDEGIKPDVEVKMTADDVNAKKDPQLDKALEIITSSIAAKKEKIP